jgi:hypothetical protein
MKRRILAFATLLVMALGVSTVAASPAFAEGEACPGTGYICVWTTSFPGYSAPAWQWFTPNSSGCINFTGGAGFLNDQVRAIKLTWDWSATLYEHGNCGGNAKVTVWNGQIKTCWNTVEWKFGCMGGSSIWYQHPWN